MAKRKGTLQNTRGKTGLNNKYPTKHINKNNNKNKKTNRNRVNSDVPGVQAVPALQVRIYQENSVHLERIR